MFKNVIEKIVSGQSLQEDEMIDVMEALMSGKLEESQIGALLVALRMKGESLDEITGAAKVMRNMAEDIHVDSEFGIDTCGTGGDGANTFNISTTAAIVAAACGSVIVKHGGRSVSSKSGSADVLEALGINISMAPKKVEESIKEVGMGFLFAPNFHKAMKYAAGTRKKLATRTMFNLLGPLTNPARVKNQLMGVYDENVTYTAAAVLQRLGVKRAMVVHGMDGIDEITVCNRTKVSFLKDGEIRTMYISPEDFGIKKYAKEELVGGTSEDNAKILKDIFDGKEVGAKRDAVILNAGAAIYVSGKAETLESGIEKAREAIDTGKAKAKLEELVKFSRDSEGEAV